MQDTTERLDTDVLDGGYSDCSDIEVSPYRETCNIRKRKKRKPFPRKQDFPEEEVTGNTSFDNTVVENILFIFNQKRKKKKMIYLVSQT